MANNPWGNLPPSNGGSNKPSGGGKKPSGSKRPSGDNEDFEKIIASANGYFEKIMNGGPEGRKNLIILLIAVLSVWMLSGFYMVNESSRAVVTRFGEFVRVSDPGLNFRMPWPIENETKVNVQNINELEVGFRSSGSSRFGIGSFDSGSVQSIPDESLMLTGDENIIDINFGVQWRVSDPEKFLFNVRDPEDTLKAVSESAMREVIGRTAIAKAISGERTAEDGEAAASETSLSSIRAKSAAEVKELIIEILDSYDAGIFVKDVNVLKIDPPEQVIEAFRDVQTAKADKERIINEAQAYENEIIPKANGEAARLVNEAQGYKEAVIARAKGEADRFNSVYKEYVKARDVTKKRMYLETMEEIMAGMDKMIIDNDGGVLPYLPLDKMRKSGGSN